MEVIKNIAENLHIKDDEVILDIESTGLSPKYAAIYMIGLIYKEEGKVKFEQLFALKKADEYEILFTLFKLIKGKTVITYNGDSFDMNFIKKRAKLYSLDCPVYKSIDLIKPAKKVKNILGLEDVKLKSIEKYFGYFREDEFTGGMLIELYYAFLENKDKRLKQVILLHNYDDLLGLYQLYLKKDFLLSLAAMKACKYEPKLKSFLIEKDEFIIELFTDFSEEKNIYSSKFSLEFSQSTCSVKGKILKGNLKHFFKDYTNYFYLPEEDLAVHKSVGKFIKDKEKEKAKKENCYIKEDDIFLPSPKNTSFLLYKSSFESKEYFISLSNIKKMGQINEYVKALLSLV